MKKLVIAAMALALSAGVNAQTAPTAQASSTVASIGGFTVTTLTVVGISAAVAAAILTNAQESGFVPDQGGGGTNPIFGLVCNPVDGQPVDGICTNNSTTVTVTGTGTSTSTITVPVVTTYPAILTRLN